MSGDQQTPSFGDPNAQPPTPTQTPTSAIFPSPVFETPKNNQGRFEESSGWTPRFAEEYSVFNATPGNLRGSNGPFPLGGFGSATPYAASAAGQKRPLSVESIAAAIATHANHFSPSPNLPLAPLDPSKILRSSLSALTTPAFDQPGANEQQTSSPERSAKKARRGTVVSKDQQGQTITPPPSAHKGSRKLAPKLDTNAMQNDQGFGQPDFMGAAQQGMGGFVTTPSDMFSFPLSAPATTPGYPDQRHFWDPADPAMGGMDIDFSAASGHVYQNQDPSHRPMSSMDWARANHMFQDAPGVVPHPGQENGLADKGGRHIPISQAPLQSINTSADQSMFNASYPTPVDDPYGMGGNGGGVNPGLLFSRPPSSSMDLVSSFDHSMQAPTTSLPLAPQAIQVSQPPRVSMASFQGELRRSASAKDVGSSKRDRAPANSPVKSSGRPGLSRSFSESRGKKQPNRSSLPALAPAPRPQSQLSSNVGPYNSGPVISQPSRPSGRASPLKNHHQRLSSLSSIPESASPRARTQAKFTIDANGRARVETTVIVDDVPPPAIRKRHSAQLVTRNRHWASSEEDESSSEDDEPIIIPSRNSSFVLPDPRKPTTIHPFHSSQRSVSEHSTTSFTTFRGPSQDDGESEGETVIDEVTPKAKTSGDAASELRRLRESRQRQIPGSASKPPRLATGAAATTAGFAGQFSGQTTISPTTLVDTSLPTPSSSRSRKRRVRCKCNRPDDRGDEVMVQCDSCEMWAHGRCVNITERTMSMFICTFCINTPNMRGGRIRDNGRMSGAMGPPAGSVTSPLAHKSSFKSFR